MFNYTQFITQLSDLGERQLGQEHKARLLIENILAEHGISYQTQEYEVDIPRYTDHQLLVGGVEIASKPCGFVSGEITQDQPILSSLVSSQKNLFDANINYNERCEFISKSNHYHAPALAVNYRDVETIRQSSDVRAHMNVVPVRHTSANILVGNTVDPKILIVSHYDSIETGSVDNATGVALSLDLICNNSELLASVCFAVCGNEEISYDIPIYWGHGYRELEQTYSHLVSETSEIIVLDSFGFSSPIQHTEIDTVRLGFPIKDIERYIAKTVMISGDIDQLMTFYHAENDTPEHISDKCMQETKQLVLEMLGQ